MGQGVKSLGRGIVKVKLRAFLGWGGAVLKSFGARAAIFCGAAVGRASLVFFILISFVKRRCKVLCCGTFVLMETEVWQNRSRRSRQERGELKQCEQKEESPKI